MIGLIALVRLVPYALLAYIAWHKGYRWLAVTIGYVILDVVFGFAFHPNRDLQGILGSVVVILLTMHVLRLPNRKHLSGIIKS